MMCSIKFLRSVGAALIRGGVFLVLGFSSLAVVAAPVDVSKAFKIQGEYLSSATDVQVNGKSVFKGNIFRLPRMFRSTASPWSSRYLVIRKLPLLPR